MTDGIKMKYILTKADGSNVDSHACYFVLRLDTDKAARKAMRVYAAKCDNQSLQEDIIACLDWLDRPPPCTCGGRDRHNWCPFHDPFLGNPVWRYR